MKFTGKILLAAFSIVVLVVSCLVAYKAMRQTDYSEVGRTYHIVNGIGPISDYQGLIDYLNSPGTEPVTIYLASEGGSSMTGAAIAEAMRNSTHPTTIITGPVTASAATTILVCAKEIKVRPSTLIMQHKAYVVVPKDLPLEVLQEIQMVLDMHNAALRRLMESCPSNFFTKEEMDRIFIEDQEVWFTGQDVIDRMEKNHAHSR